ncbi:hypothetical protein [[Eubacterium] cellulosolvens]
MTHSLHRRGDQDSLSRDYVVLTMSAGGINDKGSAEPLRKAFEIAKRFRTVNLGDMRSGNIFMKNLNIETLMNRVGDRSIMHAVFTDKTEALAYIEAVKKADLGMSVVLSGIFDEISSGCKTIGVTPHTIHFSLGTFGKTELLPKEDILWITTMCGHHQVSPNYVQEMANQVKTGRITAEDAGKELAKLCVCGIFNPKRAAEIVHKIAKNL